MRAVFVNHCHPDCPHVCGTRAREFAQALAHQGHRIVLLTETLHREDPAVDPAMLPAALAAHDWTEPFRLAVRPRRAPVLESLRTGRLPAALRAGVIAYQYFMRGGMFTDWRDASEAYWQPLADAFQPEVVWGIFGNTDAWAIAQGIARKADCPWVGDLKDQWTAFIPALFRASLSRRYADASAITALSRANAENAAPWFLGAMQVIYSGVSAGLPPPRLATDDGRYSLALIGAIYEPTHLNILVEGLRRYCLAAGRPPRLIYVGTDSDAVKRAAECLKGLAEIDIREQLPFADYWSVISAADLNIYIRTAETGWWHHKLVELLAARRPILCVPGEVEEAHQLARQVKGVLLDGNDAAAVAAVLDRVEHGASSAAALVSSVDDIRPLAWERRSEALLGALQAVVSRN